MTFRVFFFADQLLLNEVKKTFSLNKKGELDFEDEIGITATSILSLHAGIEGCLNLIAIELSDRIPFQEYEKLGISDKINVLYKTINSKPSWDSLPLQDIQGLIQYRNWLTHYKLTHIGLTGSSGYLKEEGINISKLKPENLNLFLLERYYSSAIISLKNIVVLLDLKDSFEYLFTEDFRSILAG